MRNISLRLVVGSCVRVKGKLHARRQDNFQHPYVAFVSAAYSRRVALCRICVGWIDDDLHGVLFERTVGRRVDLDRDRLIDDTTDKSQFSNGQSRRCIGLYDISGRFIRRQHQRVLGGQLELPLSYWLGATRRLWWRDDGRFARLIRDRCWLRLFCLL